MEREIIRDKKSLSRLKRNKLSTIWFIAFIAIVFAGGAFLTLSQAKEAETFMKNIMLSEANMLANALDYRQIERLKGDADDLKLEEYKYLNQQIVKIRYANPKYRYLYLMGRNKEKIPFFYMDTEPPSSEFYSPPGQLYTEEAPTLKKVFDSASGDVSNQITDRWGTWISALVPVKNPNTGKMVAVFGMDFDARDWNEYIISHISSYIITTVFVVVVLICLLLVMKFRRVSREKEIIAQAAEELENFFRIVPDLLCIIDKKGEFIKINQDMERLVGLADNELLHNKFTDFVHPEDVNPTKDYFAKLKEQKIIQNFTIRFRSKSGDYRTLEWRIASQNGFIYAAARDITDQKRTLEELSENRRFLADLIENSGAIIAIKDLDGKYRLVNSQWEETTGFRRGYVLGKTDEILFPGEPGVQFRKNDLRVIETGTMMKIEEKLNFYDGDNYFISIKFPIKNEEGKITGVCGMITDITERKRAEEALRESEAKLRRISENISDVVFTTDLDLNTTYISPSVEKLIGCTPEEFLNKSLEERYPPDSIKILQQFIAEEFEMEKDPSSDKNRSRIIETEYYRADGSIINVSTHASFIRDERGNPIGFQGITRDITAQKKAEEALRKSEEQFRALTENSLDAIMRFDRNLKHVYVNRVISKQTGIPPEEFIGKTHHELGFPNELIEMWEPALNEVFETGVVKRMEFQLPTGLWIDWLIIPELDMEGKVQYVVITARDITERKLWEDDLKESEERFKKLFNDSFDPVLLLKDGIFVEMNKAAITILGYSSKEELYGKAPWDISPEFQPDGQSSEEKAIKQINEAINIASNLFEWVHTKKNGEELYVEVMLTPIVLQHEAFVHVTWHDLTLRKKAEAGLIASEKKFRELTDLLPVTVFETDMNGMMTFVNKIGLDTFGYSIGEFNKGISIFSTLVPEDIERASKNMKQIFMGIETQGVEYSCLKKDGTVYPVLIKSSPILENGKPVGLRGIVIDITDRKNYEEALKQSEKRFRDLFDYAPVGYYEIDKEGLIVKVNNTELKMLGYDESEMLNHFIWEFVVEDEFCKSSLMRKLSGERFVNHSYELTFKRKNGSMFVGLLEDVMLKIDTGEVIGLRSTVQDITLQKQHEVALHDANRQLESALTELRETQKLILHQERMRSLGQMASGIAHDINNSLSPVIGYSDLLLRDHNLDVKTKHRVQLIKTAGLDIVRTIERMKEFYRPKIEEEEFNITDLNSVIKSTIDLTRHKWKNMAEQSGKVINIETDLREIKPVVKGHESEIREALTNLILNAIDAMPGGGSIKISCFDENDFLALEVKDEGIGMDEETLNHCMDPFYTTKGESGTGLGLSMVYGIMQRHQGLTEIESELGKGTVIKLKFPKIGLGTSSRSVGDKLFERGFKILCIDDNESMKEILQSMLSVNNHQVVFASSGKEGLNLFFEATETKTPFDLVITDLGMPYMDGKSVADGIKSRRPETPVILMTGWGAFIDRGSLKNIEYILKKPITIEEIDKAIKTVMKGK